MLTPQDHRWLLAARETPNETRTTCETRLDDGDVDTHQAFVLRLALGWACYTQGDLRDASRAASAARASPLATDGSEALIQVARLEAGVLVGEGKLDQARLLLESTIQQSAGMDRSRLFGTLGHVLKSQGDDKGSLAAIDAGLDDARVHDQATAEAALLGNRAVALLDDGRFDDAEHDLLRAIEIARLEENQSLSAISLHNLGVVNARRGKLQVAIPLFDEASQFFVQANDRTSLAHALLDQSRLFLDAGLLPEAESTATYSLRLFEQLGSPVSCASALRQGAQVAASSGKWHRALDRAESAVALLEEVPDHLPELRRASSTRDLYQLVDALETPDTGTDLEGASSQALADTDPTHSVEAARLLQRAGRSQVARSLFQSVTTSTSLESARLELDKLVARASVCEIDAKPSDAAETARKGIDYASNHDFAFGVADVRATLQRSINYLVEIGVRAELQRGNPSGIIDIVERAKQVSLLPEPGLSDQEFSLLSQMRAIDQSSGDVSDARTAQLERRLQVLRRARTNRANPSDPAVSLNGSDHQSTEIIYLVTSDERLWAIDCAGAELSLVNVGPLPPIERILQGARLALAARSIPGSTVGIAAMIASLQELLRPLLDRIADRAKVNIVPDPSLGHFPWALLVDTTVAELPSLRWMQQPFRLKQTNPNLALFAGPRLEFAEAELAAIASTTATARTYVGADATVDNALAEFSRADLAHFATHGRFRSDNPLYTSLELADGHLSLFDLLRVQSPAGVVLSACDVGRNASASAAGVAALLASRGCQGVLASSGPTNDESTHRLMGSFYERLALGDSMPQALHVSLRPLLEEDPSLAQFTAFGRC